MASANLTYNDPQIADLSDKTRPTKFAEKFSELYDNQWTDAFEECECPTDEDKIRLLSSLLRRSYTLCEETCGGQLKAVKESLSTLKFVTRLPDVKTEKVHRKFCNINKDKPSDEIEQTGYTSTSGISKSVNDMSKIGCIKRTVGNKDETTNDKSTTFDVNQPTVDKGTNVDVTLKTDKTSETADANPVTDNKGANGDVKPTPDDIADDNGAVKPTTGGKGETVNANPVTDDKGANDDAKTITDNKGKTTFNSQTYEEKTFSWNFNDFSNSHKQSLLEMRAQVLLKFEKEVNEAITEAIVQEFHLSTREKMKAYVTECVHISWEMFGKNPPVHIGFSNEVNNCEDLPFRHEIYKPYTRSGTIIDYVVWPPLYLHKYGPLLCKGIAQAKQAHATSNK